MEDERMENFNFYVPTDIRFGKDRLDELPAVLDQFGKNVLLVYGGGSIKRNGLYQQITDLAQKNGHTLIELSGVEPNPRIETVRKGIELCKENQVDVILAVGGAFIRKKISGQSLQPEKGILVLLYQS